MSEQINEEILELLDALTGMIEQYMPSREVESPYEFFINTVSVPENKVFEHACMTAGERASDVLMKYGLAYDDGYSIVPNEKFYLVEDYNSEDAESTKALLKKLNE